MNARVQFAGVTYFPIPPDYLVGGKQIDFPLSIHLVLNKSMVLRYAVSSIPTPEQLATYKKKGLKHFACPEQYYPNWLKYLESISPKEVERYTSAKVSFAPEVVSNPTAAGVSASSDQSATTAQAGGKDHAASGAQPAPLRTTQEDIAKAKAALGDKFMSQDDKKKTLKAIGDKLVGTLNDIASDDIEKKKKGFEECKNMTKQIIDIAMQSHKMKSVYEDLMMLKTADLEHSSAVSTIATIFSLTLGFVDDDILSDITLGAMIHDLGHSLMPLEIFDKPYEQMTDEERTEYSQHPFAGVTLMADLGEDCSDLVRKIVEDHHEMYSGKGFFKGLSGPAIDDRVQVVNLADHVEDLMSGKMTGRDMNPVEAFHWLGSKQRASADTMFVSPDIFETVFQVVMNTKPKDFGA